MPLRNGVDQSNHIPDQSSVCLQFPSTRVRYKMKLLTHNFLTSKAIKGVKVGHPLILNVSTARDSSESQNSSGFPPSRSWQRRRKR